MGSPGQAVLAFCRSGGKTVVETAFAASPLRVLMPKNHGHAAWVFLASLGGGLVDGDCLDVRVDVAEKAAALLGTQASTKVYRSPRGCSQRLTARVENDGVLALVPDPVGCFAGARYAPHNDVDLAPEASRLRLDGYTCGRSARGERWEFARYASRTTVKRGGVRAVVDSTRLDPVHGPIAERMGRFDVALTLLVVGPRLTAVRESILTAGLASSSGSEVVAASPIGSDGCIVRVFSERFESASHALRSSFTELARFLGDDPMARKW